MNLLLTVFETFPLDPSTITNWPAALVAVVLILCVVALPSILTVMGNKRVQKIETSITQNNGGKSVKDYLDRIEARQVAQEQRLDAVEAAVSASQRPSGLLARLLK